MAYGRITAAVVLILGLAGAGYALARSGPRISLGVHPATIYFRQPKPNGANVDGRLSSGRAGARVMLELRRWPFHGPFKPAGTQRTARGGKFNFIQRPSRATEYRVSFSGSTSAVKTLYVYPGFEHSTCTWSGSKSHGSCAHAPTTPGSYTMHFSFDYRYPAAVVSKERSLPVFVYFAECFRCTSAPGTLQRQGKVSQIKAGSDSAHVSISQNFSVRAGQQYRWYLAPCTQTTERGNGFGLPGKPGSHHCGRSSLPTRYFEHGRELG